MIKMQGKKIGVEKLGKTKKTDNYLAMPEDTNSQGVIKYVGKDVEGGFKVGDNVYFGNQRTPMTIEGKEVYLMEEDNIVALVQE